MGAYAYPRLRYPILFQLALLLFSPIQPYQLCVAGNLFSGVVLTLVLIIAISTFSRLCLSQVGTFLVLLLLVLYYS